FIKKTNFVKIIVAPHTIRGQRIQQLRGSIKRETVLFSQMEGKELSSYSVFIIDAIGLLTKIYSYADFAYVGGAAVKTGLHNILELVTFGIPIVIGNNYANFLEAEQLRKQAGLYTDSTTEEATEMLHKRTEDKSFIQKPVLITEHSVQSTPGANVKIIHNIH